MAVPLLLVGCNHSVAPIELRERLAITKAALPDALQWFLSAGANEVFLLSTCNRTEVYATGCDHDLLVDSLARLRGIERDELDSVLYRLSDEDAVEHLFSVAAGLDSMVIGEVEILGQVRTALAEARATRAIGKVLDRLVSSALAAGKRVRAETDISTRAASTSNAAFNLARSKVRNLREAEVLVLGAGEVAESTARIFASYPVRRMYFANRTINRSQRLAVRYGGRAVPYLGLSPWLEAADVVISATNAPHTVIHANEVQAVMARRTDRPLHILDLAVPRDVEPAVGTLPNVVLHNIDDLNQVIDRNLAARRASAIRAKQIVAEEAAAFVAWNRSLAAVRVIRTYRSQAEEARRRVLEEFSGKLATLSPEQQEIVERLTRRLTNRILHQPTIGLKSAARQGELALDTAAAVLLGEDGERAAS